jgi:hypothetical protein
LGILCTTAFSVGFYIYSDRRIKKDFEPINNSLEILEKINLTTFKYIDYVMKGNMTNAQKQKVKLGTIQCTGFKIGKDLSFS